MGGYLARLGLLFCSDSNFGNYLVFPIFRVFQLLKIKILMSFYLGFGVICFEKKRLQIGLSGSIILDLV